MSTTASDFRLLQPAEPATASIPQDGGFGGFLWLILSLAVLVASLTALGAGQAARCGYTLGAAGIAFLLFKRAPVAYVKFVLWLYFLSAFVRRLVDFQTGWVDANPILAAPILATLACLPCLFSNHSLWRRRTTIPFLIAFLCVAYGFCVGVFFVPIVTLLTATMNWLGPLVFGFFLYGEFCNGHRVEAHKKALLETFTGGLAIMGAYGILQFALAPAWDTQWLTQISATAFGVAEPFGIRVFSTMNSPVPFGVTLCVGLLLLMKHKQTAAVVVASFLGYSSLLLCSVRSAWLAWVAGAILLIVRHKQDIRRPLMGILLLVVCVAAGMAIDPVRDIVQDRLLTLTNVQDDYSVQSRSDGYGQTAGFIASIPFGLGLGSMDAKFSGKGDTGPQLTTDIGARDSGILEILFSLGWIGGLAYLGAVVLLAYFLLHPRITRNGFQITAATISLALMTQLFVGSATSGFPGLMLWGFAAISLSAPPDAVAT